MSIKIVQYLYMAKRSDNCFLFLFFNFQVLAYSSSRTRILGNSDSSVLLFLLLSFNILVI
jgi:hypothetical protein